MEVPEVTPEPLKPPIFPFAPHVLFPLLVFIQEISPIGLPEVYLQGNSRAILVFGGLPLWGPGVHLSPPEPLKPHIFLFAPHILFPLLVFIQEISPIGLPVVYLQGISRAILVFGGLPL